jgi:2',3'-cyclic-nucleotide 2'-phosphodiesterase/3'-nucleotidase
VRLTGRNIREWLEHSASLFCQITPDSPRDTPLLNIGFPGYKFEIICGLTYEIDLSQPPRYSGLGALADPCARRVCNLRWNGVALDETQEFLLATNSYRAYGIGLDFMTPANGPAPEIVLESPTANRDILLAFIRRRTPLALTPHQVWRFTPQAGARALFLTSPLARAYIGDPMLPPLEDIGNTPEGFAAFRVAL